MKIKTQLKNECLYVLMEGELDHASAPSAREELDRAIDVGRPKSMIVNLKRLSFMDSTGVGLLMGRYKKLRTYGARAYVEEPSVAVDKVFRVSGLYQIIEKIEKR